MTAKSLPGSRSVRAHVVAIIRPLPSFPLIPLPLTACRMNATPTFYAPERQSPVERVYALGPPRSELKMSRECLQAL